MCALADLPTPESINHKIGDSLVIFPVYMKVRDAVLGSSLKARTASWAATKRLVVLIVKSRLKLFKSRSSGCFESPRAEEEAVEDVS